jgi:PAS domain S-box-containing protein
MDHQPGDGAPYEPSTDFSFRDAERISAEIISDRHGADPFAEAVRATRMPMVITNPRLPDNPIVFANNAFCRLTGYAREEILGRNCRFLQGPETDPAVIARIRGAIAEQKSIEIDIRNHRKTGEPFWNRLLMAPVHDSSGQLTYFFASQVDVTIERERLAGLETANAALMAEVTGRVLAQREADTRRAALLELSDDMRDLADPGDISYVAAEILGRTLGISRAGYGTMEPATETFKVERDWNAPGVQGLSLTLNFREHGSYIDDLKRGETVVVADSRTDPRTAATSAVLEAISARSFVNMPLTEHGEIVALLYLNHAEPRIWTADDLDFARDVAERTRITIERRRAEQDLRDLARSLEHLVEARTAELRASEARMRAVFQTSYQFQGLLALDGTMLDANTIALEAIGCQLDEIVGKKYWETPWFAGTPGSLGQVQAAVDAAASGQTVRRELQVNLPVGGWRWFDLTLRPLRDAAGNVTAIVPEAAELTERRRAEEALRQSQKMEAVGQLTGGLAHDFNNLLTGISGSLELLETRVAQGRTRELDRYIAAAQGAAKRAAALTHRLLAFSRRQTLDPRPTDINRLVADMEDLIRRTVGPAITVEVVAAGGLWNTLVDPNQLENALLNLCINARHAMPDGGRLTVETGNAWMDERAARERDLSAGQYVSLCVSDTGTGMTPEVIARAFDPFFTTKPLGEGTGLGLSMVYGFVRQSGGQARIYSEPGEGAMVCLYLPRHFGAMEKMEMASDPQDLPRAEDGETVLVVDDEATVRMLVSEVLEELGYIAIEAEDGKSGLKILESNRRVDLLITDVGLPGGMNGRQLADAGWALRPDMNVLFITGYAENAVIGNGHVRPGMHVLTKPVAMDALAARIKVIITQK